MTGVAPLDPARLDDAAGVLARAFHPDSGMVFIVTAADEAERFNRLVSTLGAEHDRLMTEPHWQLAFIGTEPAVQRQGFGVAVVDEVVRRADADGVPAFLDTLVAGNAAFYGRHGFATVGEFDIPDSDVHGWAMRHEPRVS